MNLRQYAVTTGQLLFVGLQEQVVVGRLGKDGAGCQTEGTRVGADGMGLGSHFFLLAPFGPSVLEPDL